jgi:hypothetical protein
VQGTHAGCRLGSQINEVDLRGAFCAGSLPATAVADHTRSRCICAAALLPVAYYGRRDWHFFLSITDGCGIVSAELARYHVSSG